VTVDSVYLGIIQLLSDFYVSLFQFLYLRCSVGYGASTEGKWWHAVAQLVEALRYKPEDQGFNSRWFHWNFSLM
jgi:hypothetical protein